MPISLKLTRSRPHIPYIEILTRSSSPVCNVKFRQPEDTRTMLSHAVFVAVAYSEHTGEFLTCLSCNTFRPMLARFFNHSLDNSMKLVQTADSNVLTSILVINCIINVDIWWIIRWLRNG